MPEHTFAKYINVCKYVIYEVYKTKRWVCNIYLA